MVAAAQRVIRADPTDPDLLAAAGHTAQLAVREVAGRRSWLPRVLDGLAAGNRRWVRANVAARRELRSMHPSTSADLADELPAWRVVAPASAATLRRSYREAERRFGVDWEYLAAINLVETGMGRIEGLSVASARGPMQFIAPTWAQYGAGDIDDPRDSILAAGRYLAARGFTERGGIPGALFAYNNHPAYVRGVTHLAEVMQDDPRAYRGYHHWQIYYLSSEGDVVLRPGYDSERPVPVRRYLRENPDAAST